MRILFLHGWHSVPGGVKPTFLRDAGHEVLNPALDDDDFDAAVRTAQAEYDEHQPDVVVGSSRGGAVAMNINAGKTPLVLLCPAWKNWGTASKLKPNSVILHSRADDIVPFADSEELVAQSGLPPETLIEVGNDHRLADPEPLKAMLDACERLGKTRQVMVVRVMVLADSPDTAMPSANMVRKKIEPLGEVVNQRIEQYWKMPELFECSFLLYPNSTTCDVFSTVLSSLGYGWERHIIDEREASAVWTPEMGQFCLADARWANVQLFPGSSIVSD